MLVTFLKYRGYIYPSPVNWQPSWFQTCIGLRRALAIQGAPSRRSLLGISSGPLALLGSILQSSSYTSFSVSITSSILTSHLEVPSSSSNFRKQDMSSRVNTELKYSLNNWAFSVPDGNTLPAWCKSGNTGWCPLIFSGMAFDHAPDPWWSLRDLLSH